MEDSILCIFRNVSMSIFGLGEDFLVLRSVRTNGRPRIPLDGDILVHDNVYVLNVPFVHFSFHGVPSLQDYDTFI